MTTYEQIFALRDYIRYNTGYQCHIGKVDVQPAEFPVFVILPTGTGILDDVKDNYFMSNNFPLQIQLIGGDEEESLIKYLNANDKFLTTINNFSRNLDHKLDDTSTVEYNLNNIVTTWIYTLKIRYGG